MADVTLAECNGNIWLIGGEDYIDDLLANTLAPGVSVEVVSCDNREDIRRLWLQNCGAQEASADPWIVHPAIANRVRRASPSRTVFFAQWSAMLDQDADAVLRAAAAWMRQSPSLVAALVEYIDPGSPAALAGLSQVRLQLIQDKLAAAGIDPSRLRRETRPTSAMSGGNAGVQQDSQRVDIEMPDG